MNTRPWNDVDADKAVLVGLTGCFVRVGIVDVAFGVELPHPDLFGRRGEHLAGTEPDELGFGVGKVGVDPGPVTAGDQIDMGAIQRTGRGTPLR